MKLLWIFRDIEHHIMLLKVTLKDPWCCYDIIASFKDGA